MSVYRFRIVLHRAGLAARIKNRRPAGLTVYRQAHRRYLRAIG